MISYETFIVGLFVLLFGLCIGSFLNVCIYRIPLKQDIVKLPSHCMSCGRKLKWYELIPVLSFLIQGGKCRGCKAKLSIQYPIIELLNGILYLICFVMFSFTPEAVIYSLLASVLIVISVIDWRTYEIPLGCNVFILCLGVVKVLFDLPHMSQYVIGFFAISVVLFFINKISKGRAIGGGDVKLMAASGLLIGWQNIILALIIGCVLGSIIHIARMKISGEGRVLAFGPYLAAGIFISALFGNQMISWYFGLLGLK